MNVEIGAEAAQFPEKEYINWIAFAVRRDNCKNVYFYEAFPVSRSFELLKKRHYEERFCLNQVCFC